MAQPSFSYADGSGNTWHFDPGPPAQLRYEPVKPEWSSSGHYDGGEPASGVPDAATAARLLHCFQAALAAGIPMKDGRAKGTGLVRVRRGEEVTSSALLSLSLPEKEDLEAALRASMPRP